MKSRCSKRALSKRALIITLILLEALAGKSASAEISADAAIQAIKHRICFETFWWDRDTFQLGKTVPITLRRADDIAYAWSTDISRVPGASQWANFFSVFTDGSRTTVGSSYGYNLDTLNEVPDVAKNKEKALGEGAQTIPLHIPANCTPRFAKDTPLKARMLKVVQTTIANELEMFNKRGGSHYPNHLQIVIADFNTDYPETDVFIPITRQVFHVALADSADPLSEAFLKEGSYPVRPEYDSEAGKALSNKIVKFGIVSEINLNGG